jgi:hypothetical protein
VREADNLPPYSADVKKSRSLNSPRPLWACIACNGFAFTCFKQAYYSSSGGTVYTAVGMCHGFMCRSQWPRGLRRRSTAARLLRSWVPIPPEAWLSVCYECCVLSGRGLCDEMITRPQETYRLWCVVGCDQETSRTRWPWTALGRTATKTNKQT